MVNREIMLNREMHWIKSYSKYNMLSKFPLGESFSQSVVDHHPFFIRLIHSSHTQSVRRITELRLVVHNELVLNEVKTVWFCFPWTVYHLLNLLLWKLWQLVNRLQWIQCVRNAKWNLKLVWFYQFVLKIMTLDHHEMFDRLRTNLKL